MAWRRLGLMLFVLVSADGFVLPLRRDSGKVAVEAKKKKKKEASSTSASPTDDWAGRRQRRWLDNLEEDFWGEETEEEEEDEKDAYSLIDDYEEEDEEEETNVKPFSALEIEGVLGRDYSELNGEIPEKELRSALLEDWLGSDPEIKPGVLGCDTAWIGAVSMEMATMARHQLRDYGGDLLLNVDDVLDSQQFMSSVEKESASESLEKSSIDLALVTAKYLYNKTKMASIAEHTILIVDPLATMSNRFTSTNSMLPRAAAAYRAERIDAKSEKLLARLAAVSPPSRKARFQSGAAVVLPDGKGGTIEATASCEVSAELGFASRRLATISRADAIQAALKNTTELRFRHYETRRDVALGQDAQTRRGAARLKERIKEDGRILPNGNVDVSAFIGQYVDVTLLDDCALDFVAQLGPELADTITKVLTTGTSGQQLALPLARALNVPLICARRDNTEISSSPLGRVAYADSLEVTYQSKHYGPGQQLFLPRPSLTATDGVLIVDDFLASGSCQEAMFRLVAQAEATPLALCVLIEKNYEGGRDFLSGYQLPVLSLATIASVTDGYISLKDDDALSPELLEKSLPRPLP